MPASNPRPTDDLDLRIIDALIPDWHNSDVLLDQELGVTEDTVRTRVGWLREEGTLHVLAVADTAS